MARFTEEQFAKLTANNKHTIDESSNYRSARGKCSVIQEQQNALQGNADNKPKKAKADGKDHPVYKVSITFLISDERERDLDGATSTVLDCLIRARG